MNLKSRLNKKSTIVCILILKVKEREENAI